MKKDLTVKSSLFSPDKELWATPTDGGVAYEDVYFKTRNGLALNGWLVGGRNESPTLLFCHGNAGNISHRVLHVRLFSGRGLNVFIFDYRGYGHSQGEVSEDGLYRDASAAYLYLRSRKDLDPEKIFPFGESMGGAVAIHLACKHHPPLVIVQSVPTTAEALFKGRKASLFRGMFDSLSNVTHLRSPLLVIHGDRDELVPYRLGKELFGAAHPPKEFYGIGGAGHNNTFDVAGDEYFRRIRTFAFKHLQGGRTGEASRWGDDP